MSVSSIRFVKLRVVNGYFSMSRIACASAQMDFSGKRATGVSYHLHQIQSLGDFAFLDVGEPEGIEIGDEFIAIVNAGGGWLGEIGGTLQVVLVQGDHCSARVKELTGPVFERGMTVSLARKMR